MSKFSTDTNGQILTHIPSTVGEKEYSVMMPKTESCRGKVT